ncbi:conodipine-P1 [Nematostella vectensis]|uniref:conodipine-P1 n=1 Tax=Nematostella vectensis TaxID=45351 RepID=UPI00139063BE|nr:conodipine-P1 [Nematostella vectensis]
MLSNWRKNILIWRAIFFLLIVTAPGISVASFYNESDVTSANLTLDKECHVVTNGCSPANVPLPYKETFTPACNKHDVCYSCGQHYKWARLSCDETFTRDMYKICTRRPSKRFSISGVWQWFKSLFTSKEARCHVAADMYYKAVRTFAASYYDDPSPKWCWDTCVVPLGSPEKVLAIRK